MIGLGTAGLFQLFSWRRAARRRREARQRLAELEDEPARRREALGEAARVAAIWGGLLRADPEAYLAVDPAFRSLHADPRFEALRRKMRLDE